jgi:broad specificity phosphatase PhoE
MQDSHRESNVKIYNRVYRFLKTILKEEKNTKILIIGHAVVNSVLISILKGEINEDLFHALKFHNASISIYEVEKLGHCQVYCENNIEHLQF